MGETIHIVCLTAPSPPDYGGVFDLYYKIPALFNEGKKIILHYFDYKKGRGAAGLETYCEAVYSYTRSSFLRSLFSGLPFIVSSRIHKLLIQRLNDDEHPVIIEGIHCSGIIPYLKRTKKVILRLHNDEAAYYEYLARWESNFFKRLYLEREYRLLYHFQKKLPRNLCTATVSTLDKDNFKSQLSFTDVHFIPCFLPWQTIRSQTGKGEYCLYHGNMAVSENEAAAIWLIKNVFTKINVPLVIAGNAISDKIRRTAKTCKNCRLVYNPPDDELNSLIRDAHIHILPSKNNTGVKLKLLHALFEGRFCITNNQGLAGSDIQCGVYIANEPEEYIQLIQNLFAQDFSISHVEERKTAQSIYNNKSNAQGLSALW